MDCDVPGISMYFTNDRIYLRKQTIMALRSPAYIHLSINRGNKLLIITPCEKDKDAFRVHYNEWYTYTIDGVKYKDPLASFINAKWLLDFLARIVGVKRDSISLRFAGLLHNEEIIIDLKHYEEVIYEKEDRIDESYKTI